MFYLRISRYPKVVFLCFIFLLVKTITKLNLGQGETFEIKIKKLAFVVQVLWTTQNFVISRCCFVLNGKEMYQEL